MRIPTDLQILQAIYDQYYSEFASHTPERKAKAEKDPTLYLRITKNYVPIDVELLGGKLGVDGDIIFGRLYYHLNKKYNYRQSSAPNGKPGPMVELFVNEGFKEGNKKEIHCIHFPYMASILAELQTDHSRFNTSILVAVAGVVVSALISLAIAFVNASQ